MNENGDGVNPLPLVAVIGRPNVGKSTLINRLIGRREAIIEDKPGVTRDRIKYQAEWNGKIFTVMDTGGWELAPEPQSMNASISAGAESAIREADLILFIIDISIGALDEEVALVNVIRKSGKPVILIGNKADSPEAELAVHELWQLGLGEPIPVSALHGRGSGDLLDLVVAALPESSTPLESDLIRRVVLLGRPNVGKSSLLNSLAGSPRALVDSVAGTTRDPIDEIGRAHV
mgnify:FL=1